MALGFLKDDAKPQKWSMIRLVLFLWAVVPLVIWAWISLAESEVQIFPTAIATIIGALGIGKSAQKFAEQWKRKVE